MSHESVITSLKKLIKQDAMGVSATDHVDHLFRESDRSTIILEAASIEFLILHQLRLHMPSLNAEEKDRIFNFEGPCGSFSNRIRIAQGLGIIDRPMRRSIEIIKEMRNAAAHCHLPITFELPEIRDAVVALYPVQYRAEIRTWERARTRYAFALMIGVMCNLLAENNHQLDAARAFERAKNGPLPKLGASREK